MDDLVARISHSLSDANDARPIAFLTGSGLSVGAVPMSGDIVEIIRKQLSDDEVGAFNAHLALAVDDGERYQQAFQWLGIRRPPNFRDRVIQLGTLRACRRDDVPESQLLARAGELELDSDRWTLPGGQAALGRILTGLPPSLRGPVLTTNFDPLTEIAVRKSGGNPTSFVNADDTSFLANLRVQSNPFVLHLHGYWRDSTTLSTPEQLELRRPVLEASLRHILDKYTLIVVGYSGWSDVVARILQDQVAHQSVDSLDILWAFYESSAHVQEMVKSHPVIKSLAAAPGNVQFYSDVDSNKFFPRLEKALAARLVYEDSQRKQIGRAGLVGWTTVTPEFLRMHEENATPESAITFLDGRIPTWADAVSESVAKRELSVTLYNTIKQAVPFRESSVDVVLGASGEGKSMVALQLASMAAKDPDFGAEVLVLTGDYLGSDSALFQLPTSKSFVLVVDDAYRFATRMQELATRIHRDSRSRLHFVLLSRDTDWYNSGGAGFAFSSYLRTRNHTLRGLTRADARSMILTWERLGPEALGDLGAIFSTEERVDTLLDSSQGLGLQHANRTLLGALLTTRYGSGLRDHIARLMSRLQGRSIRKASSPSSLLDALITISLPYAYEIVDLEPQLLCDIFGLDWPSLIAEVLEPLGDEAAITYHSGRVVIRHEMIASAVIDVALQWGFDLEGSIGRLVGAAARRVARDGYAPKMGSIAYIASRISDLPKLSVAAAEAAHKAVPSRLSYITHLSAALRRDHQSSGAVEANERAVGLLSNVNNSDQARGYLTEWGVAEGNCGNWARNSVLVGLALQDSSSLGHVTAYRSRHSVSCLLLALRRLNDLGPQDELVKGIAALTVISRSLGDPASRAWLREAERLVDRSRFPYPDMTNKGGLVADLKGAMWAARQRLESPLPAGLPIASGGFSELIRCADSVTRV